MPYFKSSFYIHEVPGRGWDVAPVNRILDEVSQGKILYVRVSQAGRAYHVPHGLAILPEIEIETVYGNRGGISSGDGRPVVA